MIVNLHMVLYPLVLILNIEISEIRNWYKKAVQSEAEAFALYEELQPVTEKDAKVLVGYKGALMAITARYAKEVKSKKEQFKEGVTLIEYALEAEPDNVELRFIRLTIQQNSPKFLKYKKNIDEDKSFIFDQFKDIGIKDLKACIEDYILNSDNFSEQEKSLVSP